MGNNARPINDGAAATSAAGIVTPVRVQVVRVRGAEAT